MLLRRSDRTLTYIVPLLAAYYVIRCMADWDCQSRLALLRMLLPLAVLGASVSYRQIAGRRDTPLFFCVLPVCSFELVYGVLQLLGICYSRNPDYIMTGSFSNPNPYAVFLAACSCFLVSWRSGCRSGTLRYMSMAVAVLSLSVSAALECRSALVGVAAGLYLAFREDGLKDYLSKHRYAVAILLLCVCAALYMWKKPSADGRLQLYGLCLDSIKRNGMAGAGPGHLVRSLFVEQREFFGEMAVLSRGTPELAPNALDKIHLSQSISFAFCDPMQAGVELGPLAMLAFVMMMVCTILSLYHYCRPLASMGTVLVTASLFTYIFEIWQFQVIGAFLLGQAMPVRQSSAGHNGTRALTLYLLPATLLAATVFITRGMRIQKNWNGWKMERCLLQGENYRVFADCESERFEELGFDKHFLTDYAYALSQSGQLSASDSICDFGLDMTGNPAFLAIKGDNCVERGEYAMARECYWRAFLTLPDRLLPLVSMANTYMLESDTVRLEAMKRFVRTFSTHVETESGKGLRDKLEAMRLEP